MKFVCVSLDFELRWGMRHLLKDDFSNYKDELDGTRDAVKALLDYFESKEIQSTWATVGALALNNWEEFFSIMTISELNKRSGFDATPNEFLTKNEKYYFASDLVSKIKKYSYTELASQTFTHIFNCESQISKEIFIDDGHLVSKTFKEKLNHEPTSIVFPRNQENYLNYLPNIGINYYRAVEKGDSPYANTISGNNLINKSRRYISSFIPFLHHSTSFDTNYTRASMFLRLDIPDFAWRLHLSRIKNEITNLKDFECFHLWWHPHNLGADTNLKLKRIDEVFEIILDHRDRGNLQIHSMDNLRKLAENRT